MADVQTAALLKSAKTIAVRLAQTAQGKAPDCELRSDARSFRNTAGIVYGLGAEIERLQKEVKTLRSRMQRIANLEVRGGADAVSSGDWQAVVEELQAIAQEALTPGSARSKPRAPRKAI